jgi:hypothetical protein
LNLLASAIPGIRDLRAPLVAGYIWLLCTWLIVSPKTPLADHRPRGPAGTLVDLAELVGPVATAAGVSVVAYLIGAVSVALPRAVAALVRWLLEPALVTASLSSGLSLSLDEASDPLTAALDEADNAEDLVPNLTEAGPIRERVRARRLRRALGAALWRLVPRRQWAEIELMPNVEALLSPGGKSPPFRVRTTSEEANHQAGERPRREDWRNAVSQLANRVPVHPPALDEVVDLLRERNDLTKEQMVIVLTRLIHLAEELRRELDLPSTLLVGDQPRRSSASRWCSL